MKISILFITLISFTISQSQIINIPDTNFKNKLLSANTTNGIARDINGISIVIDTNIDNEIQENEALRVYKLVVGWSNISNLTGIEYFPNLTHLNVRENSLINIDLTNNMRIVELRCRENNISSLNISNCPNLEYLYCAKNSLTSIDLTNNQNLRTLTLGYNSITTIDVSNNLHLHGFNISHNKLTTIDLQNNSELFELRCDNNLLTSIYLNPNIGKLYINNNNITSIDISGINYLYGFGCGNNPLTTLDLSNNGSITKLEIENLQFPINFNHLDLQWLNCENRLLSELDISFFPNLTALNCNNNLLTELDVSSNINLNYLYCKNNLITELDLSDTRTSRLVINDNINLNYINLHNGRNNDFQIYESHFENLPNLQAVCVDDLNTSLTSRINSEVEHFITFTTDCSINFSQRNQINGEVNFDINGNGCNGLVFPMSNLMLISSNNTESFATFIQDNGNYLLYTNEGDFTTYITTSLPNYFTVNPISNLNTFVGFNNFYTANFCVQPNQTINDINISLIPTTQARPGFNTTYQIVYKNVGTTQLNGNVTLEFDETKLGFSNASETINSQTSNSVTFDYSNLNPFETRTIDLEFNVSAPPTTVIDDVLNFTTTINPIASDYTTDDNIFELNQTVVGSYDPNDITCLEGNQVLYADKDKYLHYIVRFQNTGTASAINVVVKNILDNHLDWSTLQLESLSHNNRVAIKNGNEIEFIFENINLIDSTTDEPNSHGFIAYKIKPKTGIALDDIIINKADIFFDYNSPIETNTASTTIVNVLAVNETKLLDFSVYPTPTENILNIKSKTEISKIKIYNKLGQLILKNETENNIDISNLTQGLYFVKMEDINGNFGVKKIMKK